MKKIVRIMIKYLSALAITVFTICLFSCARFSVNVMVNVSTKSNASVINDSNDTKKNNNIGPLLTELSGDIFTLSHYKLPKVGDNIYGFKVNAIYDYKVRNAKFVLFEHIKSGAKLVLLSNDDVDKSAVIGFNTLTYDDKGIPHVFEHACLGGSYKYPNANLFQEAESKIYNTYLNALTTQNATIYPVSSLSDPQLFELYKFYLDGVMQPNVLNDEKNIEVEAYRYVLNNKDDDITLSGVVYSEMSGVEGNISRVANKNSLKTMFNGSYMGMNTGGDTNDIPEITAEDLTSFHKKYYHPSNMIITLYGDIDYEKYLKYTDEEYLNKFYKENIDKNDLHYIEQEDFSIKNYDFPVSKSDDVDKKTIIEYSVICEGMTLYESGLFELVLNALENSDGPIKKRLLNKYPDVNFTIRNGLFYPRPYFSIKFTNVNADYAENLKNIVEESFAEVINDGINNDVLESVINYIEFTREINKDSHGFANNCTLEYLRMFSSNNESILGILEYEKAMDDLEESYKIGIIKKLMEKYISKNNHSSMTVTVPKRGLLEEKSLELKNKLLKMKENLLDEELDALVKKTRELAVWLENQESNSLINMLRKATLSELDEYRAKCYAYEENTEGVKFIKSEIEDIKYNKFSLLFDLSGFNMEEAMKISFLSNVLLELPTEKYPDKKLKSAFDRYFINFSNGINVNRYHNGGFKPYYMFSATTLDKNLDKAFELFQELTDKTLFDNAKLVRSIASSKLSEIKSNYANSPTYIADLFIDPMTNSDGLYEYSINGINYIKFLKSITEMNESEFEDLLKELEKLYKDILNRNGMVCEIIGNFNTIKSIKEKVLYLSYGYNDFKIINRIDLATNSNIKKKIAIASNGTMQYNYMLTPMFKDNVEYTAKYNVLQGIIDTKILYPEFRAKRSAYGAYSSFSRLNSCLYTYRDPNLKESYEVFNKIPQIAKNIKLTEEELNDFKLNSYADYSKPLTKLESSVIAINEVFSKVYEKRPDRYVRYMREIKEMNLDDIAELNKIFDKMVNDGIYLTIGSVDQIEVNKDMFDEIIYDLVR